MSKLFDIVPSRFFSVLNGENKNVYYDCIMLLYDEMQVLTSTSYSLNKEDAIVKLGDYFERFINIHLSNEEDCEIKGSYNKAREVLKRLLQTGWIVEEEIENYNVNISFLDSSIYIIQAFEKINEQESKEYSRHIYNIWFNLKNFDVEKGSLMLNTVVDETKQFISMLRSLNSNINVYVRKLVGEKKDEQLETVLHQLLNEFKTKIIDKSYYKLITFDNPKKYKNSIINYLTEIKEDYTAIDTIARNRMETGDALEYSAAIEAIENEIEFVVSSFESIDCLLSETQRREHSYVAIAIEKIKYLLNYRRDITGDINKISKMLSTLKVGIPFHVFDIKYLNENSLPKVKSNKEKVDCFLENIAPITEDEGRSLIEEVMASEKYSLANVNKFILNLLNDKDSVNLRNVKTVNDDIIFIVLAICYSEEQDVKYTMEKKTDIIKKGDFTFNDFLIKRKEDF